MTTPLGNAGRGVDRLSSPLGDQATGRALERLSEVVARMTAGPWLAYSHTIWATEESAVVATSQYEAQGIALLRNVADKLLAVVRAAGAVLRYDEGDGGSRLILEADLQRMHGALTALDAAIEKECK